MSAMRVPRCMLNQRVSCCSCSVRAASRRCSQLGWNCQQSSGRQPQLSSQVGWLRMYWLNTTPRARTGCYSSRKLSSMKPRPTCSATRQSSQLSALSRKCTLGLRAAWESEECTEGRQSIPLSQSWMNLQMGLSATSSQKEGVLSFTAELKLAMSLPAVLLQLSCTNTAQMSPGAGAVRAPPSPWTSLAFLSAPWFSPFTSWQDITRTSSIYNFSMRVRYSLGGSTNLIQAQSCPAMKGSQPSTAQQRYPWERAWLSMSMSSSIRVTPTRKCEGRQTKLAVSTRYGTLQIPGLYSAVFPLSPCPETSASMNFRVSRRKFGATAGAARLYPAKVCLRLKATNLAKQTSAERPALRERTGRLLTQVYSRSHSSCGRGGSFSLGRLCAWLRSLSQSRQVSRAAATQAAISGCSCWAAFTFLHSWMQFQRRPTRTSFPAPPRNTLSSERNSKSEPLLRMGVWLTIWKRLEWSWPPRMKSICGTCLASSESAGIRACVMAMMSSQPRLQSVLHTSRECSTIPTYLSFLAQAEISLPLKSGPATPKNPILTPQCWRTRQSSPSPMLLPSCTYLMFPSSQGQPTLLASSRACSGSKSKSWLPQQATSMPSRPRQ